MREGLQPKRFTSAALLTRPPAATDAATARQQAAFEQQLAAQRREIQASQQQPEPQLRSVSVANSAVQTASGMLSRYEWADTGEQPSTKTVWTLALLPTLSAHSSLPEILASAYTDAPNLDETLIEDELSAEDVRERQHAILEALHEQVCGSSMALHLAPY